MRLTSNKSLIVLFGVTACLSQSAFGAEHVWTCNSQGSQGPQGWIRSETAGVKTTEKSSYCWSKESTVMSLGSAKSQKEAKIFQPFKTSYIGLTSQYGSPGFHLCLLAGGAPKFIDFKTTEGWKSTAICLFHEDGSFASIGYWQQSSVQVVR
jgi:hypothetical protein